MPSLGTARSGAMGTASYDDGWKPNESTVWLRVSHDIFLLLRQCAGCVSHSSGFSSLSSASRFDQNRYFVRYRGSSGLWGWNQMLSALRIHYGKPPWGECVCKLESISSFFIFYRSAPKCGSTMVFKTRQACWRPCIRKTIHGESNNGPPPLCVLNACLQCDEENSGPTVQAIRCANQAKERFTKSYCQALFFP